MKLRFAAACAALSCLALASAANAAIPITATLANPVPAATRFVAGGAVWRCEATSCVAGSADRTTMNVDTCKQVVRRVGPVTAFASSLRSLDEETLARCNATAH